MSNLKFVMVMGTITKILKLILIGGVLYFPHVNNWWALLLVITPTSFNYKETPINNGAK